MTADTHATAKTTCWKCGKKVRLRKDGTIMAHGVVSWADGLGEFIIHCVATGSRTTA